MWRIAASAVQYEIAWLVCVLAPSPLAVALFTLANLYLHLRFVADQPREPLWLICVWGIGALLDALLFAGGVFSNTSGGLWPPVWLLLLWLNFAMTLRYCFAFLQKNLWLAALIGAVAGPLSYFTGAQLNGGVVLMQPLPVALAILALVWGLLLPLLAYLARYFSDIAVTDHA